jgi:hypothetical protein
MFSNPNPECEKECAFDISNHYSTLMSIRLIQDKYGDLKQFDPNTDYWTMNCLTCRKIWAAYKKRSEYETEYREITP